MLVKGIVEEDFINYKKACMTIEFPYCTFKCDKEYGQPVCQNGELAHTPNIGIDIKAVVQRYINNPITEALCLQGLEPWDSYSDVLSLIAEFRKYANDDIVIYTGYTEEEVGYKARALHHIFKNIVVKYGRYIPNQEPHYDEILGVNLASDNQYAVEYR